MVERYSGRTADVVFAIVLAPLIPITIILAADALQPSQLPLRVGTAAAMACLAAVPALLGVVAVWRWRADRQIEEHGEAIGRIALVVVLAWFGASVLLVDGRIARVRHLLAQPQMDAAADRLLAHASREAGTATTAKPGGEIGWFSWQRYEVVHCSRSGAQSADDGRGILFLGRTTTRVLSCPNHDASSPPEMDVGSHYWADSAEHLGGAWWVDGFRA